MKVGQQSFLSLEILTRINSSPLSNPKGSVDVFPGAKQVTLLKSEKGELVWEEEMGGAVRASLLAHDP